MKVTVPGGSNAFYISVCESIDIEVEEQDEKEILLLPGQFILNEKGDRYSTYLYEQC